MIITFKSDKYFFEKERDGIKPNTVRVIDPEDKRFEWLRNCTIEAIQIINADDHNESFLRKIIDITFWNDLVIISWENKDAVVGEGEHGRD